MMRRRFRRRRRASWNFADQGSIAIDSATGGPAGQPTVYTWLLPPARAMFLMEQRNRDTLTYAGTHLWLDFFWKCTGASAALFDCDFGVIKTTIANSTSFDPDLTQTVGQWDQPSTPATLTSWDEDDDDGTDSWLWSHHIKGFSPPNATVVTLAAANTAAAVSGENQYSNAAVGTSDAPTYVCRKFMVTQEWQPDVVIRSKRRLQKGEGILLYMSAGAVGNNISAFLNFRFRTLTL